MHCCSQLASCIETQRAVRTSCAFSPDRIMRNIRSFAALREADAAQVYGGQKLTNGSHTESVLVVLWLPTVTTIVVTPTGPALVARPFPSTVAIAVLDEDQ